MLKNWNRPERPGEEELEERLKAARAKLAVQQMQIKEHKLPVLVLFEGWGTAGKGSILGKIIREIDPRFFKAATMDIPTEEELRKPFLYRYFVKIPEAGKFCFLDSGWMDEVTRDCLHGEMKEKQYKERIDSVKRFERQLTNNGYLVMKFFFHIGQKEQKKRLKGLEKNENTSWRVSENDIWQNKHYDKCLKVYDQYLN
ncbi:MAG: phosphate--AMP phosphotransferase, partial [Lachnospiraceae bacterium]|nr:phosphate--AMP phosphotransferase [Lachnospiraceae bacterium]